MRVCKHGCGVKLLGFSRANHVSTNLKKFSSSKLDKFSSRCIMIILKPSWWKFVRNQRTMFYLEYATDHPVLMWSIPSNYVNVWRELR